MTEAKEKPVHKTMVTPHPESVANLSGWKRPTTAYILLETPQLNILGDGIREWGKGLTTINAESRAEVMHQVDFYLNKGGRVLDYGNFPKLNDASAKRADKAMQYSRGGTENPWDTLERHVKLKMAADVGWRDEKEEMLKEMDALKAKLAEAEAKKEVKEAKSVESDAKKEAKPSKEKETAGGSVYSAK